jgi:hypothetical protein
MVDEERDDQELAEQQDLERALVMLRPAASRIDRDNFLFLAGRASAETVRPGAAFGRWIWPAATCLSSVAAAVLLVLLVTRGAPDAARRESLEANADRRPVQAVADSRVTSETQPVNRPVELETLPTPTADEIARALAAETNYPRLRSFVLAYGIDALPEPAPIGKPESGSSADDRPVTVRELLRQTLRSRSAG